MFVFLYPMCPVCFCIGFFELLSESFCIVYLFIRAFLGRVAK